MSTTILKYDRFSIMAVAGLLLSALLNTASLAQSGGMTEEDRRVEEELRYISGLQQWGLQDYAVEVMNEFRIKYPQHVMKIKTAELQGLIAVGDFDTVKARIAREPDQNSKQTWAMKLTLADGYYTWGKYAEAQGIYEAFFAQYPDGPDEALNEFYRESAYQYSRMLMLMGKDEAAVDAYKRVLKAKNPRHVERQVNGELCELLIRLGEESSGKTRTKYFAEAEKIANELLWVQDLWFGRAIVFLAHIRMVEGDVKKATELVGDYKAELKVIHDTLVAQSEETGEDLSRLSPLAECRYLLGAMMHNEAEELLKAGGNDEKVKELLAGVPTGGATRSGAPKRSAGAYQHFLHVFILYPNSQWAAQAGIRAREVEEILKTRFGARIDTKISDEQMDTVRRFQFQQARSAFNQQQFEQAKDSYINVLSLFPEGKTSVSAVAELCQCYLELEEELFADAVASYLAERFAGNEELMSIAGDKLLRLASYCADRRMHDKRDAYYDLYFDHYKDHPRVAGMLFMFGQERFDREDYDGALKYYRIILDDHANASVYKTAGMRVASCYAKMGDHTNEVRVLSEIVKELQQTERPGHALVNARFRLAYAYKQLGAKYLPAAYNRYMSLIEMLRDGDATYHNTGQEKEANQRILEASLFFSGVCLSQMRPDDEEQVELYRRKAIAQLSDLVKTFPESEYAPLALSQMGTFHVLLEEPEKARETLDLLRKEYPETDAARNSNFLLADSLMKLGYRDKALAIFKEMFEGSGDYSTGQILSAGQELLKAEEYKIALRAFNRVLRSADSRAAIESAMAGKGECLQMLGRYQESVDVLTDLLAKYPNSGYTVSICLNLSQAYADLGMAAADPDNRYNLFNNAVKAMNRARRFEETPGGRAKLDIGVARIYTRKARAEAKFGDKAAAADARGFAVATYQTLILTADPRDADVRRQIEIAYHECLPLLLELEKWQDALSDAGRFIEMFPRSEFLSDVRRYRTRARTRVATSGQPADDTGGVDALGPLPPTGTGDVMQATNVVKTTNAVTAEATPDATPEPAPAE